MEQVAKMKEVLQTAYHSGAAKSVRENCTSFGKHLTRHWTQEIPQQKTEGHSWRLIGQTEREGTKTFHQFVKTKEVYPAISPDWAAWRGVQIVAWTLPVVVGSLLLHGGQAAYNLVKGSVDQFARVKTLSAHYQTEKNKAGFDRKKFITDYSVAFYPSPASFTPVVKMVKDVWYGGKTVLGGLYYSLYNPLEGRPFFQQVHRDWHKGVAPLKEEQIQALSVANTVYYVLKGSLSLSQIFALHSVELSQGEEEETPGATTSETDGKHSEQRRS